MNTPKKSRILASSKSNYRDIITAFFYLRLTPPVEEKKRVQMRPSNSETLAVLCNVLLFDKNGRRWPLYINLNHKTMSKSNHTQLLSNSEQLKPKQILQNFTISVNIQECIEKHENSHNLLMGSDYDLSPLQRADIVGNHIDILTLLKEIRRYEK